MLVGSRQDSGAENNVDQKRVLMSVLEIILVIIW